MKEVGISDNETCQPETDSGDDEAASAFPDYDTNAPREHEPPLPPGCVEFRSRGRSFRVKLRELLASPALNANDDCTAEDYLTLWEKKLHSLDLVDGPIPDRAELLDRHGLTEADFNSIVDVFRTLLRWDQERQKNATREAGHEQHV